MAGPRRSPFDQADDGHQVYSPLANLVRRASNRQQHSGGIPTLRSLANSSATGTHTMDYRPPNVRSVSDEPRKKFVPPNLVLNGSSYEVPMTGHRRAQPSSPLLHTRFRASVATSIDSSSDMDSQHRDSQDLQYHHQPHSSGSDYTPSPTAHRPFQYIIDDTHAGDSPTSQYSIPSSPNLSKGTRSPSSPLAGSYMAPSSPNTGPSSPGLQFDARTSVATSDVTSTAPFQYDPRSSSMTDPRASSMTDTAPFHYDFQPGNTSLSSNDALSHNMMRASTRSSTAYNPRGTWRSSAAPEPDPFSFRDYEEPRVEPPIVVVHSPMSTIQDMGDEDVDGDFYLGERGGSKAGGVRSNSRDSNTASLDEDVGKTPYHDAYEYVYGAIEAEDEDDAATETGHQLPYMAPEPTGAHSQQRGAYVSQEPNRGSLAQQSEASDRFSVSGYTDSGSYFSPEPAPVATSSSAGRVASVATAGARYNYSRPMRAGGGSISGAGAIQPQPPQSGAVQPSLALNTNVPGPSAQTSPVTGPPNGRTPMRKGTGPLIFQPNSPVEERVEYPYQYSPVPASATTEGYHSQHGTSPYQAQYAPVSPRSQPRNVSPSSGSQQRGPSPNAPSPSSQEYNMSPSSQQTAIPRSQGSPQPPSPNGHPASPYSQYSFYSLPGSTPPETPNPGIEEQSRQVKPKASGSLLNPANQAQSQHSTPRSGSPSKPTPTAAQQALQLGISAHEQNNLRDSARYFERSATVEGGCGVGMLMWGLSLRHGWGCKKDERNGFKWLRKAAEAAVADLEGARSGEEAKAVKNELVLAIYEVGQCFFHGWGVGQDKVMAVSYFQVAARLGDCDAQQELAFCYLNGKGCKKDMRQAARWYRAAAAQGASTVGLAWIYKPKYA
ncbi:Protein DSF2 OS=Saccharomyces cerevisiae (strain ATCC 204508 / S288c) GN=DSF2 PE=1 SV=2 [Rhizoctonia solani AG-1 IB]|uniref:Protein DSF2 n=1 Tax=Thanatephorus cucumeris (strain AG1-IB / isolate 7/3/14) TaxID=1108050 RepID=M5BNP8_THACB|nr:Protein DSF2 AltName: Full=Deletion suppressor of MPT5 mutation protein 2 [Rhizoctonia solani AG-1 IB]CEL58385.1 Protein DSF2 OS=Saccharomyces cerevisiae (strain ATCC 204508 / S288c) GN=DSF2 PE=1 SV=2 [Rhizoctonia solani AG-1 IB]